jgi:hypothetical protein
LDRLSIFGAKGKSGLALKHEVGWQKSLLKISSVMTLTADENGKQTQSRVRLVGPMCKCGARHCILHFGIRF